jgi:hypothetical protein
MNDLTRTLAAAGAVLALAIFGCGKEADDHADHDHADHDHAAHDDQGHATHDPAHDHGDEVPLGSTMVGDIKVECAQGHGEATPGKELHLGVKLIESDKGASTVRAWIGTEDRLASVVAKAEYAASHDDYDVHAVCPDPLPEDAMWWIEITGADGTSAVGSIGLR